MKSNFLNIKFFPSKLLIVFLALNLTLFLSTAQSQSNSNGSQNQSNSSTKDQACTDVCPNPDPNSNLGPYCMAYNLSAGVNGNPNPIQMESVLISLDAGATASCTAAAIWPLNPISATSCTIFGLSASIAEIIDTSVQLKDSDAAKKIGVMKGEAIKIVQDSPSTQIEKASQGISTASLLAKALGPLFSTLGVYGNLNPQTLNSMYRSHMIGMVDQQVIKGFKPIYKQNIFELENSLDDSIKNTSNAGDGLKKSSVEKVKKTRNAFRSKSVLFSLEAAMAAIQLALRTHSITEIQKTKRCACNAILNSMHKGPYDSESDNECTNFKSVAIKNPFYFTSNIITNIHRFYAFLESSSYAVVSLKETPSFVEEAIKRFEFDDFKQDILNFKGPESEIINNKEAAMELINFVPDIGSIVQEGIDKGGDVQHILEAILPKEEEASEIRQTIIDIGNTATKEAALLKKALGMGRSIASFGKSSSIDATKFPSSISSGQSPTGGPVLGGFPPPIDQINPNDIWHDNTPYNLFEIVSKKIESVSSRVSSSPNPP